MSTHDYHIRGWHRCPPPVPGFVDGIDGGGIFGPPGASLVGESFTAIFTGSDCNCSGGSFFGTPNPVQDATLTINGQTFDFDSSVYGIMFTDFAQTENSGKFPFHVLNIQSGPLGVSDGLGEFVIQQVGVPSTSGFFNGFFSNSAFVPAPIAGDVPALFLLALLPWLIKRKLSSYRPGSSVR